MRGSHLVSFPVAHEWWVRSPRSTDAESGPAAEQPLAVDAAGEADERVDRGEDEHDGDDVFPERHADERAACGEHERRGERENREDVRQRAVHVACEGDVAGEVDGEERVRDRLSRRVRVLLPGGQGARGGVGDCVEREPEREPGNDERHAATEPGRGVEDAGDEESGREAATSASCESPSRPIPITLPASRCRGRTVERMISTTRLFFSSTTPVTTHWP